MPTCVEITDLGSAFISVTLTSEKTCNWDKRLITLQNKVSPLVRHESLVNSQRTTIASKTET
jgi:hypothetical protein